MIHKINYKITAPKVRVIFNDQNLGIMSNSEAQKLAKLEDLDLVEISSTSNPPVCKIIDYGKLKYEEAKAVKVQHKSKEKEIKFGVQIEHNDFNIKTNKIKDFLSKGDKVKVVIFSKGREVQFPELAKQVMESIINLFKDTNKITPPKANKKQTIFYIN